MNAGTVPRVRHIIVVGGRPASWEHCSEAAWEALLDDLGKVADHAGASWLTMRPYAPSPASTLPLFRREVEVGGCRVVADPTADGRERLAAAARAVAAARGAITAEALDAHLNRPAEADADLVVVLGPTTTLPPSLVWELAYSELVFLDVPWEHLCAAHIEDALATYVRRHRRFGGID